MSYYLSSDGENYWIYEFLHPAYDGSWRKMWLLRPRTRTDGPLLPLHQILQSRNDTGSSYVHEYQVIKYTTHNGLKIQYHHKIHISYYQELPVSFRLLEEKNTTTKVRYFRYIRFCKAEMTLEVLGSMIYGSYDVEVQLLDLDDRVRTQAIIVVCDIAWSNIKFFPVTLLSQAAGRLRDKMISDRIKALQKLLEVHRDYCHKCFKGQMTMTVDFGLIPCDVLILCYDKDCKEFRSQCMELVLVENLFPTRLSIEVRTKHWIHLISRFNIHHEKTLRYVLLQKQR